MNDKIFNHASRLSAGGESSSVDRWLVHCGHLLLGLYYRKVSATANAMMWQLQPRALRDRRERIEKAEVCRQLCPNWQYTVRTGSRDIWLAIITILLLFYVVVFVSFVLLFGLFSLSLWRNKGVYIRLRAICTAQCHAVSCVVSMDVNISVAKGRSAGCRCTPEREKMLA